MESTRLKPVVSLVQIRPGPLFFILKSQLLIGDLIRIGIVPLGKGIQPLVLQEIKKELKKTFAVPIEVLEEREIPLAAFNKFRGQYISDLLLEYLDKNIEQTALAITDADLYTKGMNFIFGQAKLNRAAVISLNRLKPSDRQANKLLLERAVKESIHEIGHILGLPHCNTKGCVMTFSTTIKAVDEKGKEFCHMCEIQLK